MKCRRIPIIALLILVISCLTVFGQKKEKQDFLVVITDTTTDEYGYRNLNGDTVIPLGKYSFCFTDTFKIYAIVLKPHHDFLAIDRKENAFYTVFPFNNGPDNISDGFFRVIQNRKIGYADSLTGKIVIQPQFECAYPFENGVAKVSIDCRSQARDEHCLVKQQLVLYK